jgi:hypothetical protein
MGSPSPEGLHVIAYRATPGVPAENAVVPINRPRQRIPESTARCDLDHTIAWDQGGITCECGLAPLCRHHHRCKQAEGWRLTQPEPGVLIWRVPCGRTYATGPTQYPA